jgi:alkanesulfonate monooxygenase SsuD/methylene tetrahydromethanopterin reductase-like flavin-dependent oxidoreductase (luciferase family)
MDVGIGIPNSISGTTGKALLEWARRSEAAGFSSLASIGAVSYPSHEELTVFAAAGAVTERIRFLSNVLIAPARSTAELAKQAATVDQLTDGSASGSGVGWRQSDFELTGRTFNGRGAAFEQQIKDLHRAWSGEPLAEDTRPVSPRPVQSPIPIYVGGATTPPFDASSNSTYKAGLPVGCHQMPSPASPPESETPGGTRAGRVLPGS